MYKFPQLTCNISLVCCLNQDLKNVHTLQLVRMSLQPAGATGCLSPVRETFPAGLSDRARCQTLEGQRRGPCPPLRGPCGDVPGHIRDLTEEKAGGGARRIPSADQGPPEFLKGGLSVACQLNFFSLEPQLTHPEGTNPDWLKSQGSQSPRRT